MNIYNENYIYQMHANITLFLVANICLNRQGYALGLDSIFFAITDPSEIQATRLDLDVISQEQVS